MIGKAIQADARPTEAASGALSVVDLDIFYAARRAVRSVALEIRPREITALIGPSGCGKSTLLRCLNRMHETIPNAAVRGRVMLDGADIYAPDVDPTLVRRRVGMVFQIPTPLRTRSIYENVAIGLRLGGLRDRGELYQRVEQALRQAALWEEVREQLDQSALALSGGQQQRLCIARAIAVAPEVLLLDEPTSALDPIGMLKIEELLLELKTRYTIVIVTHNMHQAARISDRTGVLMVEHEQSGTVGRLIEFGPTQQIFTNPRDSRTEDYIMGRVG